MKQYFLIATVLLVSSCGIYGKFETPEQDLDGICSSMVKVTDEQGQLPSWDKIFVDPYLKDIMDSVLVRNTDLKVAKLRTEQVNASLQTYRLSYLPSLNASLSKSLSTDAAPAAGLASSLSIDAFGRIRNSIMEAKESLNLSEINETSVKANLLSSTITNYGTVLTLQEQLKITNEDLERWKRNLSVLENMKDNGSLSEAAYLQAKADCQALEGGIIPFYGKIAVYESFLSRILADKPGNINKGTLDGLKVNELYPDGIPISLLSSRPDVQKAEHELAKAFYATNSARASFYPSISISASEGWSSKDFGSIVDPSNWIFSALASLSQPIFSHRQIAARLKIAKADQEAAKLNFAQTLINAGSDVYLYYMALQGAVMIKDANAEVVKSLEESLSKIEENLNVGKVDYLELLTVQKKLYDAKMDLADSKYSILNWALNLYLALGGSAE